MNVKTSRLPYGGWDAIDGDYTGPPDEIGYGDTEQEAIDDLHEKKELPYSQWAIPRIDYIRELERRVMRAEKGQAHD